MLEGPVHGQLNLLDVSKRAVLHKNIRWFTSDDLADQRVVFTHDDSESATDGFQFLARPVLKEDLPASTQAQLDFQYVGILPIRIRMKNDNPPYRVVEHILRVVTNGERKIRSDVIKYDIIL